MFGKEFRIQNPEFRIWKEECFDNSDYLIPYSEFWILDSGFLTF